MFGLSQAATLVLVAAIAAGAGALAVEFLSSPDAGTCDVHPRLTDKEVATIKANLARVRTQAFDAAAADKPDRDAANNAAEDAAFDTFVHNLRGALQAEYLRHRQALDGCF